MKNNPWSHLAAAVVAALLAGLAGCGVKVDVPKAPPSTSEIKGWSDRRVADLEKAIAGKDWRLPSMAKGLARHLQGLRINLTVGPGQKFRNTEEAVQALNGAAEKLEGWYNESLSRREGDSDEDRARLQAVLEEVKDVLRNVNVEKPTAP